MVVWHHLGSQGSCLLHSYLRQQSSGTETQIRPKTVTINETEHTTSADFLPAPIAKSTPSAESATPDGSIVVTPPLRCSTRIRQPPADCFHPENFT